MPAIFDSLVHRQQLTEHVAWRVSFIVPFILIVLTAIVMMVFCPDTPTGPWSTRSRDLQRHIDMRDAFFTTGGEHTSSTTSNGGALHSPGSSIDSNNDMQKVQANRGGDGNLGGPGAYMNDKAHDGGARQMTTTTTTAGANYGTQSHEDDLLAAASWELVEKPTYHGTLKAVISPSTITLIIFYFASFGTELAVTQIIGAYYADRFPHLGQTGSGNWAAMFGMLNAIFRPAGGMMSDLLYRATGNLWSKKILCHFLGIMTGVFLLIIGLINPDHLGVMVGLFTCLAFFEEAANGSCFALSPHVHPTSNGLITGVTGASGDLGGILFLLVARYEGEEYSQMLWIIGIMVMGLNVATVWIRPIPKGQLGGR